MVTHCPSSGQVVTVSLSPITILITGDTGQRPRTPVVRARRARPAPPRRVVARRLLL